LKLWVVVTAAGSSRRMGTGVNKLLLPLHGRPVLVHTLQYFQGHPRVDGIVVSANRDQFEDYQELLQEHAISKLVALAPGGAERQDSIRNALELLPAGREDVVAIHDGARPFLTADLLGRLMEALPGCDGCLPMVAVKDTIKRVDPGGVIQATVPRQELFAAQTPQVFRFGTIADAHRRAHAEGFIGTDDCSLIEHYGGRIHKVEGDYRNVKVTTPEDLWIVERFLEGVHG
jgi:2-C-methyl-D-erythritol 4-phosphate cytidylyltransferase